MIQWNASPVLFDLGPVQLRWYGLMFLLGFSLSLIIMKSIFRREGKPEVKADDLLFYVFMGTLVGARLGHVLFYDPQYYLNNLLDVFKIWEGGLASHGGTLGVIFTVYLFHKRNKEFGVLWLWDRCAMLAIMTGGFIRVGNLMNSEIIGRPTDVPWAFVFERVDNLPRHPSQIYEAICYFSVFAFTWFLYSRQREKTPHGQLLGVVLIGTFLTRFFVEFVKENQSAFEGDMALNMGQLLSIPFVLVGIFLLVRSLKQKPEEKVTAKAKKQKS